MLDGEPILTYPWHMCDASALLILKSLPPSAPTNYLYSIDKFIQIKPRQVKFILDF